MGLTGSLCQLQDAVVPMDQDVPGSRAERDMTVIISFLNSTIQGLEASDFWIIQNLGPEFRVIFKLMLCVM